MEELFSFTPVSFDRISSLSNSDLIPPVSIERNTSLGYFGTDQPEFLTASDPLASDDESLPLSGGSITYTDRESSENSMMTQVEHEDVFPVGSGVPDMPSFVGQPLACPLFDERIFARASSSEQTSPYTSPTLSSTDESPCSPIQLNQDDEQSKERFERQEEDEEEVGDDEVLESSPEPQNIYKKFYRTSRKATPTAATVTTTSKAKSKAKTTPTRAAARFKSVTKTPKSEPVDKKAKKRAMNKVSASKYRQKRKQFFDNMERENADLKTTVEIAERKIQTVKSENRTLKTQLCFIKQLLDFNKIPMPSIPAFGRIFSGNSDKEDASPSKKVIKKVSRSKNSRTEDLNTPSQTDVLVQINDTAPAGTTPSKRVKTESNSCSFGGGERDRFERFGGGYSRTDSSTGQKKNAMVMFVFVSFLSSYFMPFCASSHSLEYLAAERAVNANTSDHSSYFNGYFKANIPSSVASRLSFSTKKYNNPASFPNEQQQSWDRVARNFHSYDYTSLEKSSSDLHHHVSVPPAQEHSAVLL